MYIVWFINHAENTIIWFLLSSNSKISELIDLWCQPGEFRHWLDESEVEKKNFRKHMNDSEMTGQNFWKPEMSQRWMGDISGNFLTKIARNISFQ